MTDKIKRFIAPGIVFLVSVWNCVLVAASLQVVHLILPPENANNYWLAFICGLCAFASFILTGLVLTKANAIKHFLIILIALTSLSVTLSIGQFLSLMGAESAPELMPLFFTPPAFICAVIVFLLSGQNIRLFGLNWPIFFAMAVVTATVIHVTINPSEVAIIHDPDGIPVFELYVPTEVNYYLRPFSVAITMIAWTGVLLRPILQTDLTPVIEK